MTASMITRALAAREATPLLAFIAGEFADAVARLWRAPHGEFYALPAARRHIAAIGLAGLTRQPMSDTELRRLVTFARDAEVASAIAGEHASGLMRALSKAGQTLWTHRDYHAFLQLLREPAANEALRHMDDVRPIAFLPLAELPPALRQAAILRVIVDVAAARDMAEAFRLAVRMRTPEAGPRLARRWGAGGDAATVFRRVQEDLTPETFQPPTPPPALAPALARIVTRKALEQTALQFHNCLADHAQRIAEGRLAVYIWTTEPEAVVALTWDAAGWRLAEAKAAHNVDLPEARLRELVALLDAAHVRTGPATQTLRTRLDDWVHGTAYCTRPAHGFFEQLELGDLWN